MPERSTKATIKAANRAADFLGQDYTFTRDPDEAARRRTRRRERASAVPRTPYVDAWTTCVAPGCEFQAPRFLPDDVELPICSLHAAAVWQSVEQDLDSPATSQALDALRARRDAIRLARDAEDQAIRTEARANLVSPAAMGEIYYVRVNGLIKVGWTSDLHARIRSYGAGADLLVHYPATRRDETTLHRQLTPSRAKGREWYADDPIVRAFISRAVREHGEPTAIVQWTEPTRSTPRGRRRRT